MELPNLNNIAVLALLGSIGAFWTQIKGVLTRFFSFFIRTDTLPYGNTPVDFINYIAPKSKIIRWGNRQFDSCHDSFIKPFNANHYVIFSAQNRLIFLWRGFIPLFLNGENNTLKVTYLFGTFNLRYHLGQSYLAAAKISMEQLKNPYNNFYLREVNGHDYGKLAIDEKMKSESPSLAPSSSSGLFTNFGVLGQKNEIIGLKHSDLIKVDNKTQTNYYWSRESKILLENIRYWLSSKKWFNDRKITWRRGALLYGKPGSGKTKMVLEVARELGIPVTKINLCNLSDKEFIDAYGYVVAGSIILIEDIDNVFNGRENILAEKSMNKKLVSFDTLINVIGGIKEYNGIFTVISTNRISMLDQALLRPGRLDVKIEVNALDKPGREFIAKNVLRDWPDLIVETVDKYPEITAAEFENHCVELAITKFYENAPK